MQRLKYLLVYILPISVIYSFYVTGIGSFVPLILFYVAVPILELLIKPDNTNIEYRIAQDEKNVQIYDWILYLALPIQLLSLVLFLFVIRDTSLGSSEYYGRVISMGLLCGVCGINVGHELGHRRNRVEQFIGELLLLTSLNTHFLPYHNGGHHKNVATPQDSATALRNESLFTFWVTSHFGSYREAWNLEFNRMRQMNKHLLSLSNRMVVYSIANVIVLVLIYSFFGMKVMLAFVSAAVIGILLLETVNYIEHYGLLRKKNDKGGYDKVRHTHSWNSDHPIGRLLLFNLSRHSDHHYNGSKKYQILESLEESPQMPTGYPGMMILALAQPLWFWVMNRKLDRLPRDQSLKKKGEPSITSYLS